MGEGVYLAPQRWPPRDGVKNTYNHESHLGLKINTFFLERFKFSHENSSSCAKIYTRFTPTGIWRKVLYAQISLLSRISFHGKRHQRSYTLILHASCYYTYLKELEDGRMVSIIPWTKSQDLDMIRYWSSTTVPFLR